MLDKPSVVKEMKNYFPLKKTTKWKLEYYKVDVYPTMKKMFELKIDPSIMGELQLDKELSLTLNSLEMETSLLYIKFMKELTNYQRDQIFY